MKRPSTLLLILLLSSVPALFDSMPIHGAPLEDGQKALQRGQFKKAIKIFEEAREKASSHLDIARAHVGLAHAYHGLGEEDRFVGHALRAEGLSDLPEIQGGAGIVLGEYYYWQSIEAEPPYDSRKNQENLGKARAHLRNAVTLTEDPPNHLRFQLAWVLDRLNEPKEALQLLEQYLSGKTGAELEIAQNLHCMLEEQLSENPPILYSSKTKDVRPPRHLTSPQPQYTSAARKQRLNGVVITQVLIDEEGDVKCSKIIKGLPFGLSEVVIKSFPKWKFAPAISNGRRVKIYYNLTTNFRTQ